MTNLSPILLTAVSHPCRFAAAKTSAIVWHGSPHYILFFNLVERFKVKSNIADAPLTNKI